MREDLMPMIDRPVVKMSLSAHCGASDLNRASLGYRPKRESFENLVPIRRIDEYFAAYPYCASPQLARTWSARISFLAGIVSGI